MFGPKPETPSMLLAGVCGSAPQARLLYARISFPITSPLRNQLERLKEAAMLSGPEKVVGQ